MLIFTLKKLPNTLSRQNTLSLVISEYMASLEKYRNPTANSRPKSLNNVGYKFQSIKFKCKFQNETKTILNMRNLLIT